MIKQALLLKPAYGRDYSNKQEVEDAWNQDKDFIITSPGIKGKYINKSDAERHEISEVIIRYQNQSNLHSIKVGE